MSCCRGNPICQPLSLSPLPLSPCEDDDGLHFLFLPLHLPPPATGEGCVVETGTRARRSATASESRRRLWFCEGACLMEQGAKVRRRRPELSLHLIGRDEVRQRSAASPGMI